MNRIFSLLGQRGCVAFVALLAVAVSSVAYAQQEAAIPDAPEPAHALTAQRQTPPPLPGSPQTSPVPGRTITLERALELAKRNNPTLQANQTLILQNKAQEITANLRPNPVLSWDTQYLPLFEPSLFTNSNYWETQAQYDVGIGYLFERGKKRQHRLDAAKTAAAVTEAQVADAQRTVLATPRNFTSVCCWQRQTWSSLKTCSIATDTPSKSARTDLMAAPLVRTIS